MLPKEWKISEKNRRKREKKHKLTKEIYQKNIRRTLRKKNIVQTIEMDKSKRKVVRTNITKANYFIFCSKIQTVI